LELLAKPFLVPPGRTLVGQIGELKRGRNLVHRLILLKPGHDAG
jgi:hypothetical protein